MTTLLDWSHINNTPDHSDAAVQGLKDAGIRAIYAHGIPTGGEWWSFSELKHPEDIRRIRETYFSSDDQLLTLALAARAPGNSNFEVATHDWELARELGIRISVHVGMRLDDGPRAPTSRTCTTSACSAPTRRTSTARTRRTRSST